LAGLHSVELLTLDLRASELAGRIYADWERTGQPIGRADPMIAAIALRDGLSLVTGNLSHFARIQALSYPLHWRTGEYRSPCRLHLRRGRGW